MNPSARLRPALGILAVGLLALAPADARSEEGGAGGTAPDRPGTHEPGGADAASDEAPAAELPDTVVVGEPPGERDYKADRSSTATKTDTPIAEVPASIQVVPRQVIEDQAAQGLEDVLRNVSGVVESGNTLNAQSEVRPVIRGFESQVLFRNGMRSTNVGAVDLVNVESVEVLKGPASILFGAIEPGGILNYTTKKPQAETAFALEQGFGSFGHYRTTLDATGSVNESETLLYRLNAAYTDSGSFREDVETERIAVAPSVMILPTKRTELLLDFSFTREDVPFDSGIPFGADDDPLVDEDTFFGDDDLGGQTLEDTFASYRLEHAFDDVFTFRSQLQYHRVDSEDEFLRNRGVGGMPGAETLERRYQNLDATDDEIQSLNELIAEFSTGPVEHEALLGVEYVDQEQDGARFRQSAAAIPIGNDPPTDFTAPAVQPEEEQLLENRWLAFYLQEQVTLLDDRLHVLVGGRYDDFHSEFEEDGVPSPDVDESEVTGRLGVLFELTDWLSPFASVSQSFNPQGSFAVDASDNIIPPEEGLQYEGGFKLDFLDERLAATVAAYHIEKENVAEFDLSTFAFTTSDQRSRGVELDVTGRITEELQIIANYAYTDTEVLDDPTDPSVEGEPRGNVPEDAVRAWLAYDFSAESAFDGLGFGAGVRYETERKAQFDDTELDSFVFFDAGAWYRWALSSGQVVSARLNIENLGDEEYYPRASDQSIVHPGEAFSVFGTVRLEF